ncbi:MAG: (Fe-S)-binding protein [Actinobacteria bacterium]|nr:(Fe-S)-binding protein [Actinomycetota bacterium]
MRLDLPVRPDAPPLLGFSGSVIPDEDVIAACQTCGMCLGACPTYELTHDPDESPRGRIRLIKAVGDGVLALDSDRFVAHTWSCILCRACETVCPSAVPYHQLATAARVQLVEHALVPARRRAVAWAQRQFFSRPWALRLAAWLLRAYQRHGLRWLARRSRLLRWLGPWAVDLDAGAPEISARRFDRAEIAAAGSNGAGARIAVFDGCLMPLAFAEVRRAGLRVLRALGGQVQMPSGQRCCGALHVHAGDVATARALARRNLDAFDLDAADVIVTDSAGCAATLKEYGQLLAGDPRYAQRARRFAATVREFSEFVAERASSAAFGHLAERVTYQDACQLHHAQRVIAQPRELIQRIDGVEFVEAGEPRMCCGSGGTYALTNPELAGQLQQRKIDLLLATGASTVVTCNPGCHLHLRAGLQARGAPVRVVHLVELLDEALGHAAPQDGRRLTVRDRPPLGNGVAPTVMWGRSMERPHMLAPTQTARGRALRLRLGAFDRPGRAAGRDRDLLGLLRFEFGKPDRQHAVCIGRRGLVRVHDLRKPHRARERPGATLANQICPFLLRAHRLGLGTDREDAVFDRDVEVVGPYAGQGGPHDEVVAVGHHVQRNRPGRLGSAVKPRVPPESLPQPIQRRVQPAQIGKRIPSLESHQGFLRCELAGRSTSPATRQKHKS